MEFTKEHIKAIEDLIAKYDSIRIKNLQDLSGYENSIEFMNELTGFGYRYSCGVCISVKGNCYKCIHNLCDFPYNDDDDVTEYYCTFNPTYDAIENSETPSELLKAIKARAKYLKQLLKERTNDNN